MAESKKAPTSLAKLQAGLRELRRENRRLLEEELALTARLERSKRDREDLADARRAIHDLLPENMEQIVGDHLSIYSLKTLDDVDDWERVVITRVVEVATRHRDVNDRALCPLCGGEPDGGTYAGGGYKVPLGLERHLEGYGSNIRQCRVLRHLKEERRDSVERRHEWEARRKESPWTQPYWDATDT